MLCGCVDTARNGEQAAPPAVDEAAPEPGAALPDERSQAPTRTGAVVASGAVVDGADGAIVSTSELSLPDGTILLNFSDVPIDPGCLELLELEMDVVAGGGVGLAVYPSVESQAHQLKNGASLGATILRDNRPRSLTTVPRSSGTARWNVLAHYRSDPWVSSHDPGDEAKHFALAVRPTSLVGPNDVVFASLGTSSPPSLRWSAPEVC